MTQIRRWLGSQRLYFLLLSANLVVAAVLLYAFRDVASGDQGTYLGYANGLKHGRYSYWFFFPDYIPDTFRNPGYPLFLLGIRLFTDSLVAIKVVQLLLYFASVLLILKLLGRFTQDFVARNAFLLLLLPNIQLAYFAANVFPEVLVAFLITLYFYCAVAYKPGTWRYAIVLALLTGCIFQVRPVFALFPFAQIVLDFWFRRPQFRWLPAAGMLALFFLTCLPYGMWNYRHHGTFKVTSLEGGAGVMQIGFWSFRMPGYREHRYWGNVMGDEMISFVDEKDVPGYIRAFNQEWDAIDAQCAPLLTDRDKKYVPVMKQQYPWLFPTYNAAYTQKREKLLFQYTLQHIKEEPVYFLKTRLYTAVRLWVTGVQRPDWEQATSALSRLKVLYPTVVSGVTFLLALVLIPWALLRHRRQPFYVYEALALALYFGLIHVPFSIQARYTVPVRLLLLLCIAVAFTQLIRGSAKVESAE